MQRILVTSIPKSGTHLLINILAQALGETPRYVAKGADFSKIGSGLFYGHIRVNQAVNLAANKWKVVCLIRDPRDIMLSMRDFLKVERIREKFREGRAHFAALSPDDQLRYLIHRSGPQIEFTSIKKHCTGFIEWRDRDALIIKYRDVLSGKANLPLATFLDVDPKKIEKFRAAIVGTSTKTFNRGVVDRWKSEMSDDVLTLFHRSFDYYYLRSFGFTVPFKYRPVALRVRSYYKRLMISLGRNGSS